MGYFSEIDIMIQEISGELEYDWQAEQFLDEQEMKDEQETEIDFDENNYIDGAWWSEQDAQMQAEELAHIEALAEIVENRTNGYGE